MRVIYWIRRDLRLADNPALQWAAAHASALYPVYIHAPQEEAPWAPGAASCWWLHHSLAALQKSYAACGQRLLIRQGASLDTLQSLARTLKADAVVWNRLYEPAIIARDKKLKQTLRDQQLEVHSFKAHLLFEPWEIETGQQQPYKVFTPFWKNARQQLPALSIAPAPKLPPASDEPASDRLNTLQLLPQHRWGDKLAAHWQVGEDAAHQALEGFAEAALADYPRGRDRPAESGTSRLSPHLHFGEISPRQIAACLGEPSEASESYLRELGWREFAHHLLYHFPDTPQAPFKEKFRELKWRSGTAAEPELDCWQRGATGIDLVDAGMRELWDSGWMHNRVRMVAASLLCKNLGIHWHEGARWFWDTLVDADLANNTLGWQWVAGCGADAAPYFRIFNAHTQAEKFDPQGRYRQRWLGSRQASPIVDLKQSREQALARYAELR